MAEGELKLKQITTAMTGDGTIELFGVDDTGAVWRHIFQKELWVRMPMGYQQAFGAPLGGKLA